MKNILTVLFLLVSMTSFSQIKKVDTTEICLPYSVGKQIMLDLNRLDSTTAILKLTETEVIELNKKIDAHTFPEQHNKESKKCYYRSHIWLKGYKYRRRENY